MNILSEIFESLRNYKDEAVGFNQKGYVGQSMSVRAKQAYDDGEIPKSKWSKAAMLDALAEEFGDKASSGFKKISKKKLFDGIMKRTSWHHTGKFANATDFYSFDRNSAIAFADKNNIHSMDDIISNDKDYQKQKSDAEQLAKEWEIKKQKEEEEKQKKKEKEKEIRKEIPAIISNSLSEITVKEYKYSDVYYFECNIPNNWRIAFHAYLENDKATEELNDFYNDLKNEKETDKTKYIYNTFDYIFSMSPDSDGKNMIYKEFNIKQL